MSPKLNLPACSAHMLRPGPKRFVTKTSPIGKSYCGLFSGQCRASIWRCSSLAIWFASISGGKRTGAPMETRTFPGAWAIRLVFFISNRPSRRMGTTGRFKCFASRPMPARNGWSSPSGVVMPSGKISELQPRSARSPAKAKLRRKPASLGNGKTLKSAKTRK
jgi:hypothetical protein